MNSYQRMLRILAVINTAEMPEPSSCSRLTLDWYKHVGPPDHYLHLSIRDHRPYGINLECTNSNGKVIHKSDDPSEAELCMWMLWLKNTPEVPR